MITTLARFVKDELSRRIFYLVLLAVLLSPQSVMALEGRETSTLPPGLQGKAVGPMAKADTALRRLFGEFQAHAARGSRGPFVPGNTGLQYSGGRVVIDAIAAGDASGLQEDLRDLGLTSDARYGPIVSGFIPIGAIGRLVELDGLQAVRASWRPIMNAGLVTSEGVVAMGADLVGYTGSGVTIGVLSDSYDHLGDAATAQVNDDLPASITVLDDTANCGGIIFPAPCSDEGRAMMELVHDVAPGSDIVFHTAFNGEANFAQGILELADAGARIIVDDVFYVTEPMFQDGIIAQAVDIVVGQGVAYFSSAGNQARQSYEAPYRNSGEPFYVSTIFGLEYRGMLHDFDPNAGVDYLQAVTVPAGATLFFSLQWDQPANGAQNDVDAYLTDSSLTILASSVDNNNVNNPGGTGVPNEVLQFTNSGATDLNLHLLIALFDGAEPGLIKYVRFGGYNITTEYPADSNKPTSYGHANAAGAEAVGAAFYQETPPYGESPALLEWFSSAGGVPILFDLSGNPLPMPDLRQKPEIVGPDGTNTTFFYADSASDPDDRPNFFGTSAAAPHVAALAALMKEANSTASPAEIYAALESTALDMGALGVDDDSGYGFVSAPDAIAAISTGGDIDPPTPDPMTWASVPAATGQSTIAMTATTASDPSGGIVYQFECVAGGANCVLGAWQSSPSYTAAGLDAATSYTFRMRVRDALLNATAWSTSLSATTDVPSDPPVADAGPDQTVLLDALPASLNGGGSSPNIGLTYVWSIVSKPRKAIVSLVFDPEFPTAEFNTDRAGTYEIQLAVSNANGSSTDTVVFTVEKPPKNGGGGGGSCNPKSPKCNP